MFCICNIAELPLSNTIYCMATLYRRAAVIGNFMYKYMVKRTKHG